MHLHYLLTYHVYYNYFLFYSTTEELEADVKIVEELRELGAKYCKLLLDFKKKLKGVKIDDAKFYLNQLLGTDDFTECVTMEDILNKLSRNHVDTFNVHSLRKLAEALETRSLKKLTVKYEETLDKFLTDTNVVDFQKAVVAKATPVLSKDKVKITIRISRHLANNRVLKDMENLASRAFGQHHKQFVCFHVTEGSIIISWHVTKSLCELLQRMALRKETIWRQHGVDEVSVGLQCVFKVSIRLL